MSKLRELCSDLAKKHGATVLTDIFQGESPKSLGGGVCRAIVAHWIASNIQALETDSWELASAFRSKAEDIKTGKTSESFITHQSDYNFHRKAFTKADEEYKEALKEVDDWGIKLDKDKTQGNFARWQVAVKEKDKAYDKAMELGKKVDGYKTMFTATIKKSSKPKFSNFLTLFRYKVAEPGFYFLAIGEDASKHALGVYTSHKLDSCVLIDPNSCEWVFPNLDAAAAFFTEYVESIKLYASWMNEPCQLDYIGGAMLYEPLA